MKLNKIIASVASLALIGGVFVGCASNKSDLSEINVTYVQSPLNVPSILQKTDDLFGKEFAEDGIAVNFHEITAGPDQTNAMAAGEIDIAHGVGGVSAIMAASNGVDLKILNSYSRSPKGYMLLTNNPEIKTVEDLIGKTISGPKGTILHQVLIAALKEAGYSIDDVNFVSLGIPEGLAALEEGSVDATLAAGPTALSAVNNGSNVVVTGEGLVSGIVVTAVSTKFAEENPEIVERFLEVHKETYDYIINNEEEMLNRVSEIVGLSLEDTKALYSLYDFNYEITDEDMQALIDTQEFAIENGLQETEVNIEELIYKK